MEIEAPNALGVLDARLRNKCRFEAYGIISATSGKAVSNRALAKALQMDPRGLRQVLEKDPHFLIELRGESYRTEPWYLINPNHPPLVLEERDRESIKLQRVVVGGEQGKLTTGDAK